MGLWRFRSRGVMYATLFVLGVWLTSMVTINLSTVTKGYQRSSIGNIRVWSSDKTEDFGPFSGNRLTPNIELNHQLAEVARSLHRAKLHARGTKTSDELRHSISILDDVLQSLGINKEKLLKRNVLKPKSVCPEKYMGSTVGYPFFYKGFEMTKCSYAKPISKLVTVVIYINGSSSNNTRRRTRAFIKSMTNIYNLTTVIASKPDFESESISKKNIKYIHGLSTKSDGYVWNRLVTEVKTPYVLIARDVEVLNDDARLERLVREIEMLQVSVVAGAFRYPNGQWRKGCYQSVHKNFTLRYLEGYDESLHECIFCDYTTGPFVTSVEILKSLPFVEIDMGVGLFEDWFLRLGQQGKETIVCPDSMFHVVKSEHDTSWKPFMDHWGIYKLLPTSGRTVISDCPSIGSFSSSRVLPPCKLKANAIAVNFLMNACDNNGIICELQEGTALGAVKLEKVLPWERDADIAFLSGNYTAFQKLAQLFKENGFIFIDNKSLWCCADNRTAGGKFNLGFKTWSIEMYGQHIMDSEVLLASAMKPTRVLLDGNWVTVPRNPGLFVRNRYGHEIYQHAVHWLTTRSKSGWEPYKTNVFPACDGPGQHDCLDRYNADGDLPFTDPLP